MATTGHDETREREISKYETELAAMELRLSRERAQIDFSIAELSEPLLMKVRNQTDYTRTHTRPLERGWLKEFQGQLTEVADDIANVFLSEFAAKAKIAADITFDDIIYVVLACGFGVDIIEGNARPRQMASMKLLRETFIAYQRAKTPDKEVLKSNDHESRKREFEFSFLSKSSSNSRSTLIGTLLEAAVDRVNARMRDQLPSMLTTLLAKMMKDDDFVTEMRENAKRVYEANLWELVSKQFRDEIKDLEHRVVVNPAEGQQASEAVAFVRDLVDETLRNSGEMIASIVRNEFRIEKESSE